MTKRLLGRRRIEQKGMGLEFEMWESEISAGAVVAGILWGLSIALVMFGWAIKTPPVGHLGLIAGGVAASLTVIRDNQRTRRMLRRSPNEVVAPLRQN